MDVNGCRTLDNIKRLKLSAPSEKTSEVKKKEEEDQQNNGSLLLQKALESSPFVLDGDPAFGLFLRARRDLKAGELLHDDTPAFFGPSADLVQDYTTPLCLGCCVVMNDGNGSNRCPSCEWPICGTDCDNLEHHKANECELFVKHKVSFPPNVEIQPCYKAIAIIRGLLIKERDPELWKQLMTLQYETQLRLTPNPDFAEFKENFGLPEFGDEDDWMRILGIINVNSYSFQRVEKKDGSPSFGECLFPIYSLMCHSCTPNCTWAITYSPSFTMKVRPTVDIKKGEMLNVCYNHEYSKFGFHKRQEKIRERAEFNCKCQRCVDPTDLGTYAAAVKCFKCKEGFMLPEPEKDDSLTESNEGDEDEEQDVDWKCEKCPYKMCSSFISSFVESLYEQSDMAEDEAEETGEPVVKIFENFIFSTANEKVHPNHWVITEASLAIIKLQAQNISNLDPAEKVDKFIELCKYLLKIRNVLAPGFSNERGMLHHSLARGLYRRLQLSSGQEKVNGMPLSEFLNYLNGTQKYAIKFWRENPHYETLTATYKREPEELMKEASDIAEKLKNIPT